MATRWIGDLSSCFLLQDGWAFRLKVNPFQLKGKPGWQMPLSVADALSLDEGDTIELPCSNDAIAHRLWIERRSSACVGGDIEVPLKRLACRDEDLAFVVFRHDSYVLIPRYRHELPPEDPLGSLLWHCGLDPNDELVRADPWPRLARALGGTGHSPEAVAERLRRRNDKRLLAVLEDAVSQRRGTASSSTWPACWQYVLPDQDEPEQFILQRGDGCVRIALGVLDGTAQPPRELTLGDAGTLWATLSPADELGDARDVLRTPPSGLIPSAARSSWVRWMRADHAGRRAALVDEEWRIDRHGEAWRTNGRDFGDLADALLSVRVDASADPAAPAAEARAPYPRNGMAFIALIDAALRGHLRRLESAGTLGYRAIFGDGQVVEGVTLVDALAGKHSDA